MKTPDIQKNIPLKDHTSWKVGGTAEFFYQPKNLEELQNVSFWAFKKKIPMTVLSGGSNVLVSDQGVSGLVISMSKIKGVQESIHSERLKLEALAGTPKFQLMRYFLKHHLAPALFLSGLPGDVGGGVVMNAGVREKRRPREFCELADWVDVVRPDGEKVRIGHEKINWSYRHSQGWQPGVIYNVGLSWPLDKISSLAQEVKKANELRVSKQPLESPTGGSTFMNPSEDKSAGALIEDCGLKGFRIGGAQVSLKHANFIVNTGKASAQNIADLIRFIQKTVWEKKGIQLICEVKWMGDWEVDSFPFIS